MARRLVWSPEAIEDVEAIAEHIQRDSPHYARAVAAKIVDVAESVPENPLIGRIVPEIQNESTRERLVYKYRLIYKAEAERILIAAVIHGSRQLEPAIEHIKDA